MILGISGKIGSGKDTVGYIIQHLVNGANEKNIARCIKNGMKENPIPLVYPYFEIKKFADKLKDIVCLLIGCTREQLEDREFKEKELGEEWWQYGLIRENTRKPILYPSKKGDIEKQLKVFNNAKMYINKLTPRKLLQLLGTECCREIIHPNCWVSALFADYVSTGGKMIGGDRKYTLNKEFYPNWIITDARFPNEADAVKKRDGIMIRINRNFYEMTDGGKVSKEYYNNFASIKEHPSETGLDDYKDFDYVIDNDSSIEDLIGKVKEILIKEKIID